MENTYIIEDTINDFVQFTHGKKYCTIYADPPWQFANRTGKNGSRKQAAQQIFHHEAQRYNEASRFIRRR